MHCEPVLVIEKAIGVIADARNTGLQEAPKSADAIIRTNSKFTNHDDRFR
jgi:hypothetical protein